MKNFILALLTVFFAAGCSVEKEPKSRSAESAGYILIDVRSVEEFNSGYLQGAVNIPHTAIADGIGKVAPDKSAALKLYCRSGRRVGWAMESLQKLGYKNMENLGGLSEAQKILGLPVVKR